jgi:SAM-dependent methyltransferase
MYNYKFFKNLEQGSKSSAEFTVPLILNKYNPKSVIECGCGHGNWAKEFLRSGAVSYIGVDGGEISEDELHFDRNLFKRADLNTPFFVGKFDLAVCLETAEHLHPGSSSVLVETLTRASEIIIFSAGIPGQGGTGHLNEQWLSFWIEHFSTYGFFIDDWLRKEIWNVEKVEYWYRQNLVVFQKMGKPILFGPVDIVHPKTLEAASKHIQNLENQLKHVTKLFRLVRAVMHIILLVPRKIKYELGRARN